ncbi:MAG: phospholipase D-like domain-containing protein [Bacteroidota bacterium]
MKKLLGFSLFIFLSFATFGQTDIADARTYNQGQIVTITGIVINNSSLGPIRYIQDDSGGLPVYDPPVTETWNIGDEVTVTGPMSEFMGLIQISPSNSSSVNSSGNALPDADVVPPNAVNINNEGQLVRVNDVTFDAGGATFSVGTYTARDINDNEVVIYVRSSHPLVGTLIPVTRVNLTGISSQFNGVPQLLLRDENDIEIAVDFYINSAIDQTNIIPSGFDLSWSTNAPGIGHVRYGETDALELGHATSGGMTTDPTVNMAGLDDATIYLVQPYSVDGADTAWSSIGYYSTRSLSTGVMKAYFNAPVDVSVSSGNDAVYITGAQVLDTLIALIESATETIDCSVLNNGRQDIVNALTAAHNSGIRVRYIADQGSANTVLTPSPAFPVVKGNGDALMHNKFMVIDAETVNNSWVWTGSTNWTNNNISTDPNNIVLIQDQALARTYVREFEEMWGSDGDLPGIFNAKFGENKTDNTPHKFVIGGSEVECYFSPSDNTTSKIEAALLSATNSIEFALLSFTHNALGSAINDQHDSGVNVRGIIESTGDQGTEYDFLVGEGINVQSHPLSSQLHHKYALVDENIVVTGSHNWSNSAEQRNDENTLIIYNDELGNQFLQEFTARWLELVTSIDAVPNLNGLEINLYPNPAPDFLFLDLRAEEQMDLKVVIYDMNGQVVSSFEVNGLIGQNIEQVALNNFAQGAYVLSIQSGDFITGRQFRVIK